MTRSDRKPRKAWLLLFLGAAMTVSIGCQDKKAMQAAMNAAKKAGGTKSSLTSTGTSSKAKAAGVGDPFQVAGLFGQPDEVWVEDVPDEDGYFDDGTHVDDYIEDDGYYDDDGYDDDGDYLDDYEPLDGYGDDGYDDGYDPYYSEGADPDGYLDDGTHIDDYPDVDGYYTDGSHELDYD